MKYAVILDGNKVIDVLEVPPELTINECFHHDVVERMVHCSNDDVKMGWTYNAETGEFTAPQEHQA